MHSATSTETSLYTEKLNAAVAKLVLYRQKREGRRRKTEVEAGRLCTRCCQVGDFRKVGFAGEEHHTCFCVWKIHSDFFKILLSKGQLSLLRLRSPSKQSPIESRIACVSILKDKRAGQLRLY